MSQDYIKKLEQKVEHLEFKLNLMFNESNVNRFIFEYDITKVQYDSIMDLMDETSERIQGEKISNSNFENRIYKIVPQNKNNYHFVEYLVKSFWEDGRWEEVFPALYGEFPKYQHILKGKSE